MNKEQLLCLAVEQGQIPRYLYKYCTVKNALEVLKKHSVWFATNDQFNDPFDCAMQISSQYSALDWRNYLTSQGVDANLRDKIINDMMVNATAGVNIIRESVEEIKKNIGILCLSDRCDNLSLWAYYADKHQGVCLEFDILADPSLFSVPKKVSYDESFPVINYLQNNGDVVEALSHKSKDWLIEGEYRIIKHNVTGLVKMKPEALTKVILGLRCSDVDTNNISQALSSNIYPNVRLCRAIKNDFEYKLSIVPL